MALVRPVYCVHQRVARGLTRERSSGLRVGTLFLARAARYGEGVANEHVRIRNATATVEAEGLSTDRARERLALVGPNALRGWAPGRCGSRSVRARSTA